MLNYLMANWINVEKNQKFFSPAIMILLNFPIALHAFFAISGYLVATQFIDLKSKYKFSVAFFSKAIIYRFMR